MIKPKPRIVIISVIVVIIVASIGWHFYKKFTGNAGWGGMPPSPVAVITAKTQDWQRQIQATGTLNAEKGIMLKSEVSGRVTKIFFESGQEVKVDAPLLEINPSILQAQLNAAVAQADLTKGDYERAVALYKRGALSKQDLDTALANKNANAAQVEQVQAQLNQNIIRAPITGRLGIRQFNLGDYITAGQNLVNLQSLNPLRVDFTIPENDANGIFVGNDVQLQTDAVAGKSFSGTIQAIDSAVDINSRSVAIRAEIPNPDETLLPGSFAEVTVLAGKPLSLVTIPQTAVVYDADGDYVYTVVKDHAVKTPITIADKNSLQVAVKTGLKAGDQVVSEGQLKVMDGGPVMIIPENPAAGK